MSSYLLYELNHAFHAFIATPKLQFQISNPMSKIIQNINFSPVSQNSDSGLKLNSTHQHELRSMLNFQNRTPDIKILKIHANWDNSAYLENHDFQRKLFFQFWDCHWIHGVENRLEVVSNFDFESWLALHARRGNLNWHFLQFVSKNMTFYKWLQT